MSFAGRAVAALVVAAFLLAPAVPAQITNPDESTPTELYFHIWDPFNKFVINTQAYNASFFEVGGVNFPTVPSVPVFAENGWNFNTVYGYSTAGPVEYDFIEGGKPRLHPERGIAADVQIDPAVEPTVRLFVEPRGYFGGHETPAVLPEVTFRVTMREGDDPGSDLDSGDIIMQGEMTAYLVTGKMCALHTVNAATTSTAVWFTTCGPYIDLIAGGCGDTVTGTHEDCPGIGGENLPQDFNGKPILYADADESVEVVIPMELLKDVIPKDESYNIRLDWYQTFEGAVGDDEYMISNIRMVLAEDKQSRLEMNILNPVYIEFIHPQVAAGTLLVHTGVNSPWGTYDIDAQNIQVTIDGPSAPQNLETVVAQNQHVHGLHDKAAEITYLWKFRDEQAADGEYIINMAVQNAAGTATALGTAGFRVEGEEAFGISDEGEIVESTIPQDEANDSPAAGMLVVLALVGAALVLRRKRA